MQKIVIIRHGRTEANEKWFYSGHTDLPLTEGGVAQLAEMRETLKYPDITGFNIYTTDLVRTQQTLKILFGEMPFAIVPGLKEMCFGAFEMKQYNDIKDTPEYQLWINGPASVKTPGGESNEEFSARVISSINDIISTGKDSLVVCHGGTISVIMSYLFPNEGKSRLDWQPSGGSGYEIVFDNAAPISWRIVPE